MKPNAPYGIAALYVAVSPLLNRVLVEGGWYGPLAVLVGGGVLLLLALGIRRWGRNAWFSALYAMGLLAVLLATTTATVDRYLYHSSSGWPLAILLTAFGGVCLWVRGAACRYTARVFLLGSLAAFLLVAGLSLRQGRPEAFWPVERWQAGPFGKQCLCAAVGLMPLLLPALDAGSDARLLPVAIGVAGVAAWSALSLFVYPRAMLTAEKNLIIEITKNLSFGRFFQRMEFVGSLLFLLLSLLMILMLSCRLAESLKACLPQKKPRRWVTAGLYLVAALPAFLRDSVPGLVEFAFCLSAVAAVLAVLFACPGKRRSRIAAAALALCLLSSCVSYREIDTQEYPRIVGVEAAGDAARFSFRTDDATYTVPADSLQAAKNAVNLRKPKPMDLSQLGMVLVDADSFPLIEKLLAEIQDTDIHNAVQIAVTENRISELEEADFSSYQGISEYLNEYKSKQEAYPFLDNTAFKASTALAEQGTCLLPLVGLHNGQLLTEGAVAFGGGETATLSNEQVERLLALRKRRLTLLPVEDGVLRVQIGGAEAADLAWLESVYQKTGADLLDVYPELAKASFFREKYEKARRGIQQIVLDSSKN